MSNIHSCKKSHVCTICSPNLLIVSYAAIVIDRFAVNIYKIINGCYKTILLIPFP